MSTNFNDTVPAAPSGGVNVKWQTDGSGNVSAYLSSAGAGVGFGSLLSGTSTGSTSSVAVQLGSASNYAILASSGITNTGSTVIAGGNIGSSPTPSITGFPPGTFVFPAQIDNADAAAAQTALAAAITFYQGLSFTNIPSALDSQTLTPGNYNFASGAATLSGGTLTLNGAGTFVIKTASTLTVAAGSTVLLTGGATVDNVVFVIGSSATFAGANTFVGNILAVVSITLNGGTLNGRALANTGAVTISSATTVTSPAGTTTLVIGSGSILTFSGTGIINANEINGVLVTGVPSVGQEIVATSATTATWQTVTAPFIAASVNLLAQAANISATTLFAVLTSGMYRVSAEAIVTQVPSTSSTLPKVTITWTDPNNSTAQTFDITPTLAGSPANLLTDFKQGSAVFNAKAVTNIQYATSGYASVGGTPMQYALSLRLEKM